MGNEARAMRVLVCLAALLVIVAAIEDVEELEDHAADPYNDGSGIPYANPVGGTGYFPHGMNFPGPKYGLPGYKESHDWEGDFDIMSPLVFDYRMYGALINAPLKDKPFNEEDLKVHWTNQVFSAPTGGCPQGNLWFNANRFKSIHGSAFTEFTMQTVTCDVILKVFLTKAVYEGYQVFSVPTTNARASPYPTMGAKLFEGTGGHTSSGDFAEGAFQVKNGQYFSPPESVIGAGSDVFKTNMFLPARHMTLAFWMKVGDETEAPNAELFGYGRDENDHYFRTGWGCTTTDFQMCYWIVVFMVGVFPNTNGAKRGQYFHTYKDGNADKMSGFKEWTFVYMDLSTEQPNFNNQNAEGCPADHITTQGDFDAGVTGCSATLDIYVGKRDVAPWGQHIEIIDWTDGTRSNGGGEALKFSDDSASNLYFIHGDIFQRNRDGIMGFWVTPELNCDSVACGGTSSMDASQQKHYMWQFPWHGAYLNGVWFCDFHNIPSGNGGFGDMGSGASGDQPGTRSTRAREALYLIMMDTFNDVCNGIAVTMTTQTHKYAAATGIARL